MDFTCGMTFKGILNIVLIDAFAIVYDLDLFQACFFDQNIDLCCFCVDCVLNQFFDN